MGTLRNRKFWMVWNPSGRAPTYKHETKASAETEAMRLAEVSPGDRFFVLKAVSGFVCTVSDPTPIKLVKTSDDEPAQDGDIPF
ncbi:hypothetical protein [Consotaella aegiceratis]|uniref:hypothetical protein n=1 Tax=Consotaella aegiceratis TaxID=3097961 RepID=UPI002F40EC11